jgi:hypothetical protein
MLVPLLIRPGVVGSFPGTGCMVPQPFTAGGNRSYPEFWVVTHGPRYQGYITPAKPKLKIQMNPNQILEAN